MAGIYHAFASQALVSEACCLQLPPPLSVAPATTRCQAAALPHTAKASCSHSAYAGCNSRAHPLSSSATGAQPATAAAQVLAPRLATKLWSTRFTAHCCRRHRLWRQQQCTPRLLPCRTQHRRAALTALMLGPTGMHTPAHSR